MRLVPTVFSAKNRPRWRLSKKPLWLDTPTPIGAANDHDLDLLHDDPESQKFLGLEQRAAS